MPEFLGEEQITHMVNRFLQWKLPKDFQPDCGIHFDADAAKKLNPNNHTYEPVGTNLLSADQAREMVRFMIDGLPTSAASQETLAKLRPALAEAALSLISYEESYGMGGGDQEGFDIARLLGYEDDLDKESVCQFLRSLSPVGQCAPDSGDAGDPQVKTPNG